MSLIGAWLDIFYVNSASSFPANISSALETHLPNMSWWLDYKRRTQSLERECLSWYGANFALARILQVFIPKKKKIEISIIVIRKVTFRFLKTPFEQYTALVWAHFCSPRYNTLVMCLARFTMKILGMRKDCLWFEKAQEWEDWTPKGAPFVSFLEDNNASSRV